MKRKDDEMWFGIDRDVHKVVADKSAFDLDMAMDTLDRLLNGGGKCLSCTVEAIKHINRVLDFESEGDYPIHYKVDRKGNITEEVDEDFEDFDQDSSVGKI